jgi:ABC-type nitrate/sulfonate/bicarbonate transport system substrate-binding protein
VVAKEETMLNPRVLSAAAMIVAAIASREGRAEELIRVNVFPGPQHLALFVAQEKGFFAKRGLRVEIQFTPTSRAQRDALSEGKIEIAQSAVDNAVAMVDGENKDVVIVAGGSNGMLELFVRPELKSYDDIRGKSVVVDAPDTAYALVLYKMLELKGLKRSDYGIAAGGDCTRRFNGIRDNANNVAVLLNLPCSITAAREGFPRWGSASEALGAYQADGVWVMREWARQHPDVLVKYLEAIIEGLRWAAKMENRGETAAIVGRRLDVGPDIAEKSVERAIGPGGGLDQDARLNLDGFAKLLSLRAEMINGSPGAQPGRYLDLSYYERAIAAVHQE